MDSALDAAADARNDVFRTDGANMVSGRIYPYRIDATEVTQAQYLAFLTAKSGDMSGQPPVCGWNTSWARSACNFDPNGAGATKPVTGIDWCDAYGYCAWAGKRLCGKAPNGKLEWYLACTNDEDGLHAFPYGNQRVATACNFVELDAGGLLPVGTLQSCQGGLSGLYDMLGNAFEWVDDCTVGLDASVDAADPANMCLLRSGSNGDTASSFDCSSSFAGIRPGLSCGVGFRCCADP